VLFTDCNTFGLSLKFERCILDNASFYKLKLKGITFKDSKLTETDFTECDLTRAVFADCDLKNAAFDHTNLEQADFRSAKNYTIDPENNKLRKAKFSLHQVGGLLQKYQIEIS
jgi:uncharacterized protein YjbI with pentapeptide repeats